MRILYAFQGTGNGHLMRATEIIPKLKKLSHVDVLISGTQSQIKLPFDVKYCYKGMSFVSGKNGDIDYLKTFSLLDSKSFIKSIIQLPVENYNLVINDFEPVSAWSAKQKGIPSLSLSHQCAILKPNVPRPSLTDPIAYTFLKLYAPTNEDYGFHFKAYNNKIFSPIIRKEIRNTDISNKGHITVYLPAYDDDKLEKKFSKLGDVEWHVFSKFCKKKEKRKNITFFPVENHKFVESMASSNGIISGAGFETPSEALYLGKKLLVIPMKGQFEQICNAYALEKMGVVVVKNLKEKRLPIVKSWLEESKAIKIPYQDDTTEILQNILDENTPVA